MATYEQIVESMRRMSGYEIEHVLLCKAGEVAAGHERNVVYRSSDVIVKAVLIASRIEAAQTSWEVQRQLHDLSPGLVAAPIHGERCQILGRDVHLQVMEAVDGLSMRQHVKAGHLLAPEAVAGLIRRLSEALGACRADFDHLLLLPDASFDGYLTYARSHDDLASSHLGARLLAAGDAIAPLRSRLRRDLKPRATAIVHGDLNENNVIMAADGRMAIIDFESCARSYPEFDFLALADHGMLGPDIESMYGAVHPNGLPWPVIYDLGLVRSLAFAAHMIIHDHRRGRPPEPENREDPLLWLGRVEEALAATL